VHEAARQFVHRHADPSAATIEFGARNVNGGVADMFIGRYVGVDRTAGDGVDVIADAATFEILPRWGHLAEQVVCCEVLEHAENADEIVANAARNLKPGGTFVMTCAGPGRAEHSAADGGPLRDGEFYRNVPGDEFAVWCSWGDVIVLEQDAGDLRAVVVKR
jgi:SAM-dependent methyltransferase